MCKCCESYVPVPDQINPRCSSRRAMRSRYTVWSACHFKLMHEPIGRSVPSHSPSERTRRRGSSQAIHNTSIDKPLRMHPRTYASRPSHSDRTRFALINFNCRCRARTRNLSPIWTRMGVKKKHHYGNNRDSTGCSSTRENKSMEICSAETWIMIWLICCCWEMWTCDITATRRPRGSKTNFKTLHR